MATSLVREKKWPASHGSYINVGHDRLRCTSQLTGLWLSNLHEPKKLEITEYWRDEADDDVAIEAATNNSMAEKGGLAATKKLAKKLAKKGISKKPAKKLAKKGISKKPAAKKLAKKPAASMARR